MLVLTRRKEDEIVLVDGRGRELGRIKVVKVHAGDERGPSVRLGFEFPREITILRGDAIRKEAPSK